MPSYDATRRGYKALWDRAKLDPGIEVRADAVIRKIRASFDRYWTVEATTGVPWFLIAVLHYRESANDFRGVLHNGEKIIGTGRKTRMEPPGQGPFDTWEESANDVLKDRGMDKIDDWPVSRVLYEAERYNGFGYFGRENSPYLWAGTNLSDERGSSSAMASTTRTRRRSSWAWSRSSSALSSWTRPWRHVSTRCRLPKCPCRSNPPNPTRKSSGR